MNKQAEYTKLLTPWERAGAIKLGCLMSLGRNCVSVEEFQKQAAWGNADLIPKSMLLTALMAGIPLGYVAHNSGKALSNDNRAEREALTRLKFYRQLAADIERPNEENNQKGLVV